MTADLTLYTPPSASDLEQSWRLAERIARTDFVPGAFRGKPEAVLACILAGRELGIGPMQALQSIHVIQGRPTMSADLMVGLVRRAGHRIRTTERTDTTATVEGVRVDDPEHTEQVTFTMDDANRAGLTGKDNWRQYPAAMLWARAVSALCRITFNDVLHGVAYTPEEINPDTTAATVATQAGPAEVSPPLWEQAQDVELWAADMPTDRAIDSIRDHEDAKWLLQQPETSEDYRQTVKAVVVEHDYDWRQFWHEAQGSLVWQAMLSVARQRLLEQMNESSHQSGGDVAAGPRVGTSPGPTRSASTPEPEVANRSGVEATNPKDAAAGDREPPPVATAPPDPLSPDGSGGTNRSRSGRTSPQKAGGRLGRAPTDPDPAEQAAFDQQLTGDDR